ncbi:MAG TPA: hypothetical protein VEB60_00570, partial [Candidatus Paceibacterota bacterium]|nr:hypothetical protein [Candidatus Paceibacterota bacterium]
LLLGVFALVALAAIIMGPVKDRLEAQSAPRPLTGFGWSSNIGWVSFSSTNDHNETVAGAQPSVPAYGVYLQPDGRLTGEAWSANLGWLKFDESGAFPQTPNQTAQLSGNKVIGWARFLSPKPGIQTGGWDGWLKLTGTATNGGAYGVEREVVNGREKLKGFAWGDLVVGWLNLDQVYIGGGSCTPGTPGCGTEVCGNNIDDDGDGQVDENCGGGGNPEICDNNIDDDRDGLIDENCPNSPKLIIKITGSPAGSVNVPGKPAGWCQKGSGVMTFECPEYRVKGTVDNLIASATNFKSWSGCTNVSLVGGVNANCSVTMGTADKTVIANYEGITPPPPTPLNFSFSTQQIGVANPPPPPGSVCPTGLDNPGSQYDHCSGFSTITVTGASAPVTFSATGLPAGGPKVYFNIPRTNIYRETITFTPGSGQTQVNVRTYFPDRAVTPQNADVVSPYASSRGNSRSANVSLSVTASMDGGLPVTRFLNHYYRDPRGSGF